MSNPTMRARHEHLDDAGPMACPTCLEFLDHRRREHTTDMIDESIRSIRESNRRLGVLRQDMDLANAVLMGLAAGYLLGRLGRR